MKIIRSNSIKPSKRPLGRRVKKMLELKLKPPVDSMAIYLNFLPQGKLDKHYHSKSQEIICFPQGGRISVNGRRYKMNIWDMVLLDIGDVHCCERKGKSTLHFVIKVPNIKDKKCIKP
ncbi:MAG: hypothetical protein KAJ66_02215 [Candidatus Omnitrophica bacterium]|nr:hypothetical protein [Candidatus Omnitrophota bacterium]